MVNDISKMYGKIKLIGTINQILLRVGLDNQRSRKEDIDNESLYGYQ